MVYMLLPCRWFTSMVPEQNPILLRCGSPSFLQCPEFKINRKAGTSGL